ncbi:ANTAR domain-containing protein [Kutzneria albida]|uniref:ANTAR domain-containing protein n=1 Tax=Kutzneria albida DSM 43870 TaxID=1449976 RepID=W5WIM1_9PSEU|nr:ANTAR domain-containing protein [Kutzneria albida]AHH98019.1 hypothetical protein KALB_4657 [Kutzneria albida DSM 43870]
MDRTEPADAPAPEAPASWPVVLDEVTGALEALSAALDTTEDFQVLLHQACEQVTHAVPGVHAASLTLVRQTGAHTAAITDERVAELDRQQYSTGQGPCVESARTGKLVRAAISESGERWPGFARAAREAGISSVLAAPLVVDHAYSGALNCYSRHAGGFADLDARLLELYTTAVEAALRSARRYQQAQASSAQLRRALTTRAVIDQAKGILMANHRVTAEQAFTLLVEQSQRDNIKVRDLADRLVARTTGAR